MGMVKDILVKAIKDFSITGILAQRLELARDHADLIERQLASAEATFNARLKLADEQVKFLEDRLSSANVQLQAPYVTNCKAVVDNLKFVYEARISEYESKLAALDSSVTEMSVALRRDQGEAEIAKLIMDRMSGGCVNEYDTFNAGAGKP